jgi:peptidyl-prolyl cis-trans isomerase SurA
MNRLLRGLLTISLCWCAFPLSLRAETIDAVVATVDEQPILLSDLNKLLPKPLTMSEAANDPTARMALDKLIFENLVNSEAEARRVSVSDADIERYVDEVANRNGLSREGFIEALKSQGKDWASYRSQIRTDILQTRLASIMLQGMSTVKDEELDRYLEAHPELLRTGASVTLRRIVTATEDEARAFEKRELDEEDFVDAVKKSSIAADASEGGSLGTLAEKDLSAEIFASLMHIDPGHTSEVVSGGPGMYTVYYVVERSSGGADEQKRVREEVKRQLTQNKLAQSMEGMFQTELYKNHTIDKKI